MTRPIALPAARHFHAGRLRDAEAGTTLHCLVLVPGAEWVAADIATGALLRPLASQAASPEAPVLGRSLDVVEVTLEPLGEPPDPARPEAVRIAAAGTRAQAPPRRRAVRHLLSNLVTRTPSAPLLGSLGPSIAYADLDGGRPSVVVVEPDQRPRFGNGRNGPWCQFAFGGRKHSLPLQGRPEEALDLIDTMSTARDHKGRRHLRRGPGAATPKLLVVGYGPPRGGQVPKVVLGTISEPGR